MKDYFRGSSAPGTTSWLPTLLNGKSRASSWWIPGHSVPASLPRPRARVTKVRGGDPGSVRGLSGDVAKVSFSEAIRFQFAGIQQQNNIFDTSGIS